ncbi:MAG TPA: hypothetical protein VIJ01_09240 [Candidatus Angelobacter sp.]
MMLRDGNDEKDTTNETYKAMVITNRSFEQIMSALYKLESKGVIGDDYPYTQELALREMSAKINCHILADVNERELDDRNHYSRMRVNAEKRRKPQEKGGIENKKNKARNRYPGLAFNS